MPLRSIARLIQTMLYAQRFFPYYVYNILGGIEEDGKPIPFYSRFRTQGLMRSMLMRRNGCSLLV